MIKTNRGKALRILKYLREKESECNEGSNVKEVLKTIKKLHDKYPMTFPQVLSDALKAMEITK